MSFWFPTDFGDAWQRGHVNFRAVSFCSLIFATISYAVATQDNFALVFLIPALWSLTDGGLRFAGKQPWLVITMLLDCCSTLFVGSYIPVMISNWMWSDSNAPVLVVLFLLPPLYCHGAIFIRTTLQFLEMSREQSRGAVSLD